MTSNPSSALIISPPTADLHVIKTTLEQHGYNVLAPDMIARGATWVDALAQAIGRADLIIGVCDGATPSPSVAFDLGVAAAADADILIVASPECELPTAFSSFFLVRADVTNEEALGFFFANLGPHKSRARRRSRDSLPTLTDRVAGYARIAKSASSRELEDLVATIFTDAGFDARSAHRVGPREIDLAVWSDSLAPYLDNPLLIEVKDDLSGDAMHRALAQVTNVAQAAGVRWALIVYRRGPSERELASQVRQASRILVISFDQLLTQLKQASLFDILRGLRNRKVHGVS